jgi:hypothetical protein
MLMLSLASAFARSQYTYPPRRVTQEIDGDPKMKSQPGALSRTNTTTGAQLPVPSKLGRPLTSIGVLGGAADAGAGVGGNTNGLPARKKMRM